MKIRFAAILMLLVLFTQVIQAFGASLASKEDFSDVTPTDWFYNDLKEARATGYIDGVGGNKFSPNTTITYGEYLAITARITNPSIDDTAETNPWYTKYMTYSKSSGIIAKNENVTATVGIPRQDMIKYTCKALGIEPYTGNEILFNDVSPEDAAYINAAYNNYLTDGVKLPTTNNPGTFGWDTTANRSQLAAMANRLAEYKKDPAAFKAKRAAERAEAQKKADQEAANYVDYNGYKVPKDYKFIDKESGIDLYVFVRYNSQPADFAKVQSIIASKWGTALAKQAVDYGRTKKDGIELDKEFKTGTGYTIYVHSAKTSIQVTFEIYQDIAE